MDCQDARAALSARLDGEPEPAGIDSNAVDAHLDACAECQEWFRAAADLNRRLRMTVASPVGSPSAMGNSSTGGNGDSANNSPSDAEALAAQMALLAEQSPELSQRLRSRSLPLMLCRVVMVVLALAYIVWAVVYLVQAADLPENTGFTATTGAGGEVANSGDPDLARLSVEAATMRLALAAGLLWGAWRPRAAPGLLPVFLALWAFGAGFSTRDLILGYLDTGTVMGLLLHLASCAAVIGVWLARHHVVTPLRESMRALAARPVSYSFKDAARNSTWHPGDPQ